MSKTLTDAEEYVRRILAARDSAAEQRGIERALDAVVARADEGTEFGPQNYLLLLRIVAHVRRSLATTPEETP